MPVSLRKATALELRLTSDWSAPRSIKNDPGRENALQFADIPEGPGVYRILCQMPGPVRSRPKRVYVGEAVDLKKRFRYYERNSKLPDGATAANRGLHRRLRNVLRHGGKAQYQVIQEPNLSIGGRSVPLDLKQRFDRLLVENAVILNDLRLGYAVINDRTNAAVRRVAPGARSTTSL